MYYFPGSQASKRWKDIRDAFVKSRKMSLKRARSYKYSTLLEFLLPHIHTRSATEWYQNSYIVIVIV